MLKDRIRAALHSPHPWRRLFHFAGGLVLTSLPVSFRRRLFRGERYRCPICGSSLRGFLPLHRPYHRYCPVCWSLQRHRLVWLLFERRQLWAEGRGRFLHVAPEPALAAYFRQHVANYVSLDRYARAQVKMDVMRLGFPDGAFDFVYCSHVLEHIPDDRRAMAEFYRLLRPGGRAVILVPILRERTFEDPSITSPVERERLFGQFDHLRAYGLDFADRLREAGFEVEPITAPMLASEAEIETMGLPTADEEAVFLCTKR